MSFFTTIKARAGSIVAGASGERPMPVVTGGHGHSSTILRPDRFERMFPQLPPFAIVSPAIVEALLDMGKAGGILDAMDDLAKSPELLVTDATLSQHNPNNPTHTAGTTFLGQFIDHDLTFDTTSMLGVSKQPQDSINARTPGFDLDSVYGRGPTIDRHLYDPADGAKLKVECGGMFEDVPRASDNSAIIGDPRNDAHMIIAGLHAAFLKFHNRTVDLVRTQSESGAHEEDFDRIFSLDGAHEDRVFRRARRLTTWHYQWIVVHEFLPQIIGQSLVDDILQRGPLFCGPEQLECIPVEFQGAAYRFGHSLVRPSYRANLRGSNDGGPFFGFIFDSSENGKDDPNDLRGGKRAARRFIGWQTFFRFDDPISAVEVKPNKKIDTRISTPLFHLTPGAIVGTEQLPVSLPQRTLLRQLTWGLPSGQAIAEVMGVPSLSPQDLNELRAYSGLRLAEATPLWYYILKEAEVMCGGEHLGPVGGRIVGEVFIGLLRSGRSSYPAAAAYWKPTLPSAVPDDFRMVDLLTFAEVDPISRGQ